MRGIERLIVHFRKTHSWCKIHQRWTQSMRTDTNVSVSDAWEIGDSNFNPTETHGKDTYLPCLLAHFPFLSSVFRYSFIILFLHFTSLSPSLVLSFSLPLYVPNFLPILPLWHSVPCSGATMLQRFVPAATTIIHCFQEAHLLKNLCYEAHNLFVPPCYTACTDWLYFSIQDCILLYNLTLPTPTYIVW
jgi:hypothetical protein